MSRESKHQRADEHTREPPRTRIDADAEHDPDIARQASNLDLDRAETELGELASDGDGGVRDLEHDTHSAGPKERPLSKREIAENKRLDTLKTSEKMKSQNASFHAMAASLRLLARTIDKAAHDFDWELTRAKKSPNGSADFETALQFFTGGISFMQDQVVEIRKQLTSIALDYNPKDHLPYLENDARSVLAAWERFVPVVDDVEKWAGARAKQIQVDDFRGWLNVLITGLSPDMMLLPSKGKSQPYRGNKDMTPLVRDTISTHLDAALVAARSFSIGNMGHANRVVLHLKEIAKWRSKAGEVAPSTFKPRMDELARLLATITARNPYVKNEFEEALKPVRDLP